MTASYPADGQGTNAVLGASVDCTNPTPDCPVPTDVAIELRFDRFLLPLGSLSAGLSLYSGDPANRVGLRADYDVVERVVVLRPARTLQPNALYTAVVQSGPNPNLGFWAFDHAPLEAGEVPLRFSFSTGSGPRAPVAEPPASTDTCDTLAQGPLASCASCHVNPLGDVGSPWQFPPMGLDLASAQGFHDTALAKVAHQTETADRIRNTGLQTPVRFGVQMNIVDPGNPATSYLLYKLLQKPSNFQVLDTSGGCVLPYHSPVIEGSCAPPDPDEATRAREWFIHGDPMPEDGRGPDGAIVPVSTDYSGLRRIAAWIAAGARCPLR